MLAVTALETDLSLDQIEENDDEPNPDLPPLATNTNKLTHDCFIALVNFVKIYTDNTDNSEIISRVSEELNKRGREKVLFALLSVPDAQVQEAVMGCLRGGGVAHFGGVSTFST